MQHWNVYMESPDVNINIHVDRMSFKNTADKESITSGMHMKGSQRNVHGDMVPENAK